MSLKQCLAAEYTLEFYTSCWKQIERVCTPCCFISGAEKRIVMLRCQESDLLFLPKHWIKNQWVRKRLSSAFTPVFFTRKQTLFWSWNPSITPLYLFYPGGNFTTSENHALSSPISCLSSHTLTRVLMSAYYT